MSVFQFPLTRFVFSFILGILCSSFITLNWFFLGLTFIIGTSFLFLLHFLSYKKLIYKYLFGVFILVMGFHLGISSCFFGKESISKNHYTNQIKEKEAFAYFKIIPTEKLKTNAYSKRYVAKVTQVNNKFSLGNILVSLPHSHHDLELSQEYEGILYCKKNKNLPSLFQFDYDRYLEKQGVYAKLYTTKETLKYTGKTEKNFTYYAHLFRKKIIALFIEKKFNQKELFIFQALVLGQQQDIDKETIEAYQYAGAIHILSVSGLHVGCLLLFLSLLLKGMPKTPFWSFVKCSIIILFLWLFALLAGFSPSVVRAVTMYSFVAFGIFYLRPTNIYYVLLLSLLFILLIKPSFIYDIGFQLSYVALFFIVWIQPKLRVLWQPRNKIVVYFWDILTVSFAAQLGTLPLSLYYFHQFPSLFFVTNIFILPLVSIILSLGIVVIVLGLFKVLPSFLILVLLWFIQLMNLIISKIAGLESFIFKEIGFNCFLLVSSYLCIITLVLWYEKKKIYRLILLFCSCVLFQLALIYFDYLQINKQEWIVLHQAKTSIFLERKQNTLIIYSNEITQENSNENYSIKSYLQENKIALININKQSDLFYFKGKKILHISDAKTFPLCNPDVLIITNTPKINFERLINQQKPKQIVVDGSNFKTTVFAIEKIALKEKIPFHFTGEKGPYIMK